MRYQNIFKAIFIIFFISNLSHTKISTHNGTINFGGAFNVMRSAVNTAVGNEFYSQALGGGFSIELGYLYLHETNIIHGLDTRASVGMNFDYYNMIAGSHLPDVLSVRFDTIFFQVGTTYQLGLSVNKGRLLFDIIGINIGFLHAKEKIKLNDESLNDYNYGNNFLLGINLPIGIQYILDNGMMIGFRHRIDLLFSGPLKRNADETFGTTETERNYIDYNININIGYAFS